MIRLVSILALSAFVSPAFADVMKDFDSLGGNNVLMDKVKAIEPDKRATIVQNRVVNRFKRVELAPEFTTIFGGDAYLNTVGIGVAGQFHFNPYISLGARYTKLANKYSDEGENLIKESEVTGKITVPDVDPAQTQTMAVLNLYPIYGKLNLFNKAVTHFDIYGTFGYGNITLKSGSKPTYLAGAGMGLWLSQHLSTRLEVYYQTYEAERQAGPSKMDLTGANLQIGYLL